MEKLTREDLIKKAMSGDVEWFSQQYFEHKWEAKKSDFKGNKFKDRKSTRLNSSHRL